jgi:tetratricopeptide (TPR) repeat protein
MQAGSAIFPSKLNNLPRSLQIPWWDELASFLLYGLLLIGANVLFAAQPASVDNDYKDALSLYEKRDIVSLQKAIEILERNLKVNPEHLETQALISFAYAHEAYLMQQIDGRAADYLVSAENFAKAVLAKNPRNTFAKKTIIFSHLIVGQKAEAAKILAMEMNEKESDADMWYLQALLTEGDESKRALIRALELKPNHVWIYSDMAFRAIHFNDLPLAEKWIAALEARMPGIADLDLLKAVVAAQKKKRKDSQLHWSALNAKTPHPPGIALLLEKMRKAQASP